MTDQIAEQLYTQQKNYMYTWFEYYLKSPPKSWSFYEFLLQLVYYCKILVVNKNGMDRFDEAFYDKQNFMSWTLLPEDVILLSTKVGLIDVSL